jgi:hypothetical protein
MENETTFCENHPDRETGLSCNRCGKLICTSCAVHTATGYRCKECVREQKKKFDTAKVSDYIVAVVISIALSYLGSIFVSRLGFFLLLLSPIAGMLIAEAVRNATGRRRSPGLNKALVIGIIVGGLPRVLPSLLSVIFGGGLAGLLGILWPTLYVVITASTAYSRFSGINIR